MDTQLPLPGMEETPHPPRSVHCRRAPAGSFVYVGRPHILGNPFPLENPRDEAARQEVIEAYRQYFLRRIGAEPGFRAAAEAVRGRDLGCWCAPRACHADVILAWLEEHPEESRSA